MYKTISILLLCALFSTVASAHIDTLKKKVDIARIRYHENIEKEQQQALRFNGGKGEWINASVNKDINALITNALIRDVNILTDSIEKDTRLDHRLKVKYLSGLENLLKGFNAGWRNKTFNAVFARELLENYKALMAADINKHDIRSIVQDASYEVGNININGNGSAMYENQGFEASRSILFRKSCQKYPDKILGMLE